MLLLVTMTGGLESLTLAIVKFHLQDQQVWLCNWKIAQLSCPSFSFVRVSEKFPTRSCKFPTWCMGVSRLGYPWIPWIPPPVRAWYRVYTRSRIFRLEAWISLDHQRISLLDQNSSRKTSFESTQKGFYRCSLFTKSKEEVGYLGEEFFFNFSLFKHFSDVCLHSMDY